MKCWPVRPTYVPYRSLFQPLVDVRIWMKYRRHAVRNCWVDGNFIHIGKYWSRISICDPALLRCDKISVDNWVSERGSEANWLESIEHACCSWSICEVCAWDAIYVNFTGTSWELQGNFTGTSRELHGNFTGTSRELHGNFTRTSRELNRNFTRTSRELHGNFTGTSWELHKYFTGTLRELHVGGSSIDSDWQLVSFVGSKRRSCSTHTSRFFVN